MNNKISKAVSVSLASALVLTSSGFATIGISTEDAMAADTEKTADKIQQAIEDSVTFSTEGVDKEETVYVITDANGNVSKKIVSDWVKNKDGSDTISDKSDLVDIENVKTDADYTKGSNDEITWNADGEDVYYQGTTDKELPVDVKITYLLDGKEIKADDLAGKDGKVTIRFEYTNNAKTDVTVGDEKVSMSIPFTMISGMILPGDKFSNIEISNGKVIGDGNNNIVVGYAFPGLAQDLDIASIDSEKKIDIPDTLEITADVKDFSLLTTVTVGSADLLSSVNVDTTQTRKELEDVINQLVSATDELKDGTSQIKDGTQSLQSNFVTYGDGIKSLTDGIREINKGVKKLDENVGSFVNGLKTASDGSDQIISGLEGNEGAVKGSQALATGAVNLDDGIKTLQANVGNKKDQATVIGAVNALASGTDTLYKGIGSNKDLKNNNEKTVSGAVSKIAAGAAKLLTGAGTLKSSVGSTDQKEVAKDAAKATPSTVAGAVLALATGAKQLDAGVDKLISKLNDTKDSKGNVTKIGLFTAIKQINAGVGSSDAAAIGKDAQSGNPQTLTGGITAVDAGIGQLQQGLTSTVKTLTDTIADNTAKMDKITQALTYIQTTGIDPATKQTATAQAIETYKTNYAALSGANQALQTVLDGMSSQHMAESVEQLKEGTGKLKTNSVKLAQGIEQLSAGADALKTGVSDLKAGTSALTTGASKLNAKMPELTGGVSELYSGVKQLSTGTNTLKGKMTELISGASQLSLGAAKLNSNMPALSKGLAELKNGSSQLAAGNTSLAAGVQTLYTAVKDQLKPGLVKLYDGSLTFQSGIDTLYTGTSTADKGSTKIDTATGQLSDGIKQLADGSSKLDDGVTELKETATDKVVDAYNNDITKALDRVEGTLSAAKEYDIYSAAGDNQTSTVKFIYRTDSID